MNSEYAYDDGFQSYAVGRRRHENPYKANEANHVSWDMGWLAAELDYQLNGEDDRPW